MTLPGWCSTCGYQTCAELTTSCPRLPPHDACIDGAQKIAPGVYRLEDEHHVYAVPSSSADRIHQVTVNTRTGAMRCDGPRCDGRTCSHQKRVLKARAGF